MLNRAVVVVCVVSLFVGLAGCDKPAPVTPVKPSAPPSVAPASPSVPPVAVPVPPRLPVVQPTGLHAERLGAVKAWLEEDSALAVTSGMPDLAAARRADVAEIGSNPPAETLPAAHEDLLPQIAHFEGNPVVESFLKDLQKKILDADKRFLKGPEGGKARSEEGWAFGVRSDELLRLTQAFCHPQSPRAGEARLVAPILRRLAFFAEYMATGGPVLGDFGPCGNVAESWLILSTCRPEILPPSIRAGMDQAIRNNADKIIEKSPGWAGPYSASTPCLVNGDVNLLLAVAVANRMFPSPKYAAAVKGALAYLEPHILPDGATNYVGEQNECPGYHGAAVHSLTRTGQVTGDAAALEMVKRMRWYYPLVVSSTGVMEWATATSWHHYWNTANGAEWAAVVAGLTDCPQNQRVANLGYNGDFWLASFWNPERAAAPFPDNYVTYDRNVEGPRARFGNWSFVGTTRKTNDNRGKSSYVGCVVETGKPGNWQLDSALQDAGMEIRLDPAKDDVGEHRGRITLANVEPVTTSAVGENAAALGAVAKLGSYGKAATEWTTRQAWLGTRERLVGLVTLEAGVETKAAGIFGDIFLVSGRASWGDRKAIKDLGGGKFAYGAMILAFSAHDFAGVTSEYTDVMGGGLNASSDKKSCRVLLMDDAAKTGVLTTYPKGTKHFYLVEARPATSAPAVITRSENANGLLLFVVKEAAASYRVAFNPTDKAVDLPLGPPGVLHRSGEKFRADWLKEAGAVESVAPTPSPATMSLPAGEIVFVSEK